VKVDEVQKKAFVHFNGWNPKFDTWIPFSDLRSEEQKKELPPTPVRDSHIKLTHYMSFATDTIRKLNSRVSRGDLIFSTS
jgi:hypothetical protein